MSNALTVLADKLAERFGMTADGEVLDVLKSTAFKSDKEVTNAQMTALLVVANQYGLNPWTKEIYAFPDKRGGIVPVVGVDGWSRIINEHPQFDGMDFEVGDGEVTCTIYRKDRSHPTRVTEYLGECSRGTDPWRSHPKRMLRHKAMIQCARIAFGFVGIHDLDEAERIVDGGVIAADTGEVRQPQNLTPQRKSAAAPKAEPKHDAEDVPFKDAAREPAATASGISAGEAAYLKNKAKQAGVEVDTILQRFGVPSLEQLDKGQFDEIKSELLAAV